MSVFLYAMPKFPFFLYNVKGVKKFLLCLFLFLFYFFKNWLVKSGMDRFKVVINRVLHVVFFDDLVNYNIRGRDVK